MLEEIKKKIKFLSLGELLDLTDFLMSYQLELMEQRKKDVESRFISSFEKEGRRFNDRRF